MSAKASGNIISDLTMPNRIIFANIVRKKEMVYFVGANDDRGAIL